MIDFIAAFFGVFLLKQPNPHQSVIESTPCDLRQYSLIKGVNVIANSLAAGPLADSVTVQHVQFLVVAVFVLDPDRAAVQTLPPTDSHRH